MIDIHCHILPGIDDGPAAAEGADRMLRAAEKDGVKAIFCTSHYCRDYESRYPGLLQEITDAANATGIKLFPGCEYDFSCLSEDNKFIGLGNSNFLLVDICQPFLPECLDTVLFDLEIKGYRVILAHPERLFGKRDIIKLSKLKKRGVLFQLNAASITGGNGRKIQKFTDALIDAKICHYVASDAHNSSSRGFCMRKARERTTLKFGSGVAETLFEQNQDRLLYGQDPKCVVSAKKSWLNLLSNGLSQKREYI